MMALANASPRIANVGDDTSLFVRVKDDGRIVLTDDAGAGFTLRERSRARST